MLRPTRSLALALAAFPVLYLVHLVLLEVYSRILFDPSYSHYASPFGDRYRMPAADSCSIPTDFKAGPLGPPAIPDEEETARKVPAFPEHNIKLTDDRERINKIIKQAAQIPGPYSPPMDGHRISDRLDAFAHFKHRQTCNISSLDLHTPFSPLCDSKQAMLAALSGGGRPGYNKPYIPLDCDMRWYSKDQICEIFSRFRAVVFVGDSIMRHIVEGTYVFLRNDIGLGAIADWDAPLEPDPDAGITKSEDCLCGVQTGKKACSDVVIEDSEYLLGNTSFFGGKAAGKSSEVICPSGLDGKAPLRVQFVMSNAHPVPDAEISNLKNAIEATKDSSKPIALVLHTMFWNDVNLTASQQWIERIQAEVTALVPAQAKRPMLYTTANAGGLTKMQKFLSTQSNQAIGNFEREIEGWLAGKNIDMLGCYNMSLQATSSDGTHAAFEGNLLKAMSVMNWLDWAGREASAA